MCAARKKKFVDIRAVPTIHSEYHSQSFEVNDTIRWGNYTVTVGVLGNTDPNAANNTRSVNATLF